MAKPKKGALHQIYVTMVDATDFASVESGITESDFNSGATRRFYGMNTGGSAATTSGAISKTASLVRSGVFRLTLKSTENNFDRMMVRVSKTGCAEQIYEWENVDNDDSDLMSQLLLIASAASDAHSAANVAASRALINQSRVSDVASYLVALSGMLSDTHSAATAGASRALLNQSIVSDIYSLLSSLNSEFLSRVPKEVAARSQLSDVHSDIRSQISNAGPTVSDIASAVAVEIGSRLSDILSAAQQANSRVLVIASGVSDLQSKVSDLESNLISLLTVTGVQLNASTMSDLRSAITAGATGLDASTISDIASAVVAAIGAGGVEIGASSMSDLRSAITAAASDVKSAVIVVQSLASDAHSAAAEAASRALINQSRVSDIYSLLSDLHSDVGVLSGVASDIYSGIAALPAALLAAAAADPIHANVREVNSVSLVGDGSATPWGPE